MHILESRRCYNAIPLVHYFYVKTKMLADFQIRINTPLRKKLFPFLYYFGIVTLRLRGKNCIVKNQEWFVFPESRYINLNRVTASMEKISSINKLIQEILGSH